MPLFTSAVQSISAGTTLATGPNVVFSNANGISFGVSGNTVTASGGAGGGGAGLSAGTQSVSTGTLVFSNSNNVSFGMSGSSRITASASFPAETPFGLSAGTQSVSTGTLVFSNSNNVSFGMSGSSQITASASFPAQTTFGISAGTQSVSTGTLVFSNSNGVTFGMSGSNVITASVSTQPGTPFGISAGTQSVSTGTLVFSNSNGISFGMAGSSQVTASVAPLQVRLVYPAHDAAGSNLMVASSGSLNLSFQRFSIPAQISATQVDLLGNFTLAGSTAGSYTISFAVYTFAGSTASSASSSSSAFTFNSGTTNSSSMYGGHSGSRWRPIPITLNITPGEYLIGIVGSVDGPAGTTGTMTLMGQANNPINAAFGQTGNQVSYFADGLYSVGTNAFPASLHITNILQSGTGATSVLAQPYFRMIGTF